MIDTKATSLAYTNHMEVTPLADTKATALASTKPHVYTDGGFLEWPANYFGITGFSNHVAFKLLHRDVYICYFENLFIYYYDTLKITYAFYFVFYKNECH